MKRIGFMILALALVLGAIVTALPTAKADPGPVKFKIRDMPPAGDGIGDDIVTGKPAPPPVPPTPNLLVAVVIESPYSWLGTSDGIVSYMVSVRFDPTALTAYDIAAPTSDFDGDGAGDGLLEQWAAFHAGASTLAAPAGVSAATGALYGFANALVGVDPATVGGAGGNPFYGSYGGSPPYYTADEALACVLRFRTKSATIASVFDLMGPDQVVAGIDVSCKYTTAGGTTYKVPEVDVEDGAYVADTPDAMYLDAMGTYDPASPIGSDWHELWPIFCQEWSLESWDDNGDGVLSVSDQVDFVQITGGAPGTVMWGHVDWLNPTPVPNDGITDMILLLKPPPEPEFPLGIGLLMAMVPMVAIAYVWRLRKKEGDKP